MFYIIDRFCDIIIEFADKRNKILNKISEQAEQIADNLVKIAIFRDDQWKDELLTHINECQRRKLVGRKKFPTKEEFFQLLYKEYYEPEEPYDKSTLAILIGKNIKKYKDSRDLSTEWSDLKYAKNNIQNLQAKIHQVMINICRLLSVNEVRSDYYGYSKDIIRVVDDYIEYWQPR